MNINEDRIAPKPSGWRVRPSEQRTILLLGDLVVAAIALFVALYIWGRRDIWFGFTLDFLQERVEFWFYLLPLGWLVMLVDLYDVHHANNWRTTVRGIAIAALIGLAIYAFIYVLVKGSLNRIGIGVFLAAASSLTFFWRLVYIRIFTAPAFMRRVLVIGAGKAGKRLAEAYKNLWPPPFFMVGFIDDDPQKIGRQVEEYPILGLSNRLLEFAEKERVSDIVVAITGEMQGDTFQAILDAQESGIEITPMPTLYEEMLGRVPVHHLESDWLLRSFVDEARVGGFYEAGKRCLDILGGLVGLGIFALLYPLVAFLILLDSGYPVLYKQIRSGRGGKPYDVYKFRTMRQDAEKDGKVQLTQEKDSRITNVGNFLRKTHIDELPQFINVLRGEMSLVGPRSERPEWIAEFQKQIPFYRARLLVKPGVTGWAQVNYSYYATVEEMAIKLEYDLYYIKHRNLLMDSLILLRTVGQVFGLRGR
ncbi:MAG: sugar transferase [Anaerolineales bacterium]|nr:sugar transferase [Anaerolineales bacterium]